MRGQGLCRELQRRPPVGLDHRAPWGSEDVATGPTDRHPSPQDRHCLPAGVAGSPGQDHYRRARVVGGPHAPFHSHQTLVTRGPEHLGPCVRDRRWTAVHSSAPSARVSWIPSRMSLSTGLGRRAVRTSSLRPRRNPGPSRSPSSKTSGSVAARRAATVGRCRETVHGWTETGSRGRSGQAATALPSLAQPSALSHH